MGSVMSRERCISLQGFSKAASVTRNTSELSNKTSLHVYSHVQSSESAVQSQSKFPSPCFGIHVNGSVRDANIKIVESAFIL